MEKEEQVYRILQMYDCLRKGEIINKTEMATKLEVNERTIQRDIQSIRNHLEKTTLGKTVSYSRKDYGYTLSCDKGGLSPRELLTVTKILLESRALNTTEMKETIEALLSQSTKDTSKFIRTIVGNELHHYQPLCHNQPVLDLLWEISTSIRNKRLLEIVYERMDQKRNTRIIKPVSILFSEYYFYLIAFIKDSEYQSPVFFRLDRIRSFKQLNGKFSFSEKDRFEEGLIRQRIQFMYSGQLEVLQFIFRGKSLEAVLDRFPNGHVVKVVENGWLIEAEIYGSTGCMMWLLSQGENIEVISPKSLRMQMKNRIQSMSGLYEDN